MKVNKDTYQFETTGRSFYANSEIVGISPDGDKVHISQGYDGGILINEDEEMTPEEKTELADYMIGLWQKFKQ